MNEAGSPSDELQTLVEALSLAIERPVLLDDAALSPIAYSPQWGEIDQVRENSILGRGASRHVRDALLAQGIARALEPVRTEAVPEIGMAERVCVPVRADETTVGFLWLVDSTHSIGDEEIERVRQAAVRAADYLAARPDADLTEETARLNDLCSASEDVRESARVAITGAGLIADRPLVVLRIASDGPSTRLGDFARRIAHRVSAGHVLAGLMPDGLLMLLDLDEPALSVLEPELIARWVHGAADGPLAVGQSATVGGLASVPEGRRQAELALSVARRRPIGERYAAWETMGVDRLVGQLPASALADVPAGIRRLIADEPDLAETLAVFLDSAGDVKRAAAALSLHRSGLYYRLQRIEELTGLHLANGEDRLLAHLALRLTERSS
ncbi:MAG: helix-turn-helix domain-containing protein [Solirubrobacterales bacterium]